MNHDMSSGGFLKIKWTEQHKLFTHYLISQHKHDKTCTLSLKQPTIFLIKKRKQPTKATLCIALDHGALHK